MPLADNQSKYDDITRELTDIPVTTYENLTYTAWDIPNLIGPTVPAKVGGLAYKSPPNVISTTAAKQRARGTASTTVASPYTHFSLYDFYFGCDENTEEGAVVIAKQCTILVASFQKGSNKELASATFTFTPPLDPVGQVAQIQAVLPDTFHQPLYNVTIAMSDATLRLQVDNYHYYLY